jgi:ADP-ribose pyrophosphatase
MVTIPGTVMAMELARAFRFCPACGTAVTQPGNNPLRCAQCGFVFYFSPICGVVCIIANAVGEVLMLVRAREPGRGLFGLPGGFVDPGESAEDAARREVREEVNLEVASLHYLGSFPNSYHYKGVTLPVTDLIYHCEVHSLDGLHADPAEVSEVRLCRPGPDELRHMAFDSNRRGLQLFLTTRGEPFPSVRSAQPLGPLPFL